MNNINHITDQQTMTSLEIAEVTGRNHRDVMRSVRNMEPAWLKVNGRNFALVEYRDSKGELRPCYSLTKTECLYVATKFNDEARAKLVLRWEQLEKERLSDNNPALSANNPALSTRNLPSDPSQLTRKQILLIAIEAEEENEKLRTEKEQLEATTYSLMLESGEQKHQIEQLQQRTAYLDTIMADRSTVTISQIAQDYGMAAASFNNLLRGLHIQRKVGEQWILYSDFIDKGYVATRMIPIHHAGKGDTYKPLTAWTQSGRRFIYEHLKRHGVLPLIERQQQEPGMQ